MAEALKVLGQIVPSATTLTAVYTVPAVTQATVSSISVCNQNATSVTFRISVAVNGAADDPKQYMYYDLPLLENDTFIATVGLSLAAGDVIRVRSSTANVSFNVFGVELT